MTMTRARPIDVLAARARVLQFLVRQPLPRMNLRLPSHARFSLRAPSSRTNFDTETLTKGKFLVGARARCKTTTSFKTGCRPPSELSRVGAEAVAAGERGRGPEWYSWGWARGEEATSAADATAARLRQSCGQQVLYVLRGVLLVEVLGRVAQGVEEALALARRLVLQQLHAALHLRTVVRVIIISVRAF